MIEFWDLHACSVRKKTAVQYTVARQRISVGFKLAIRGDSGAGGLVAPLHCTAYFGKLAKLFGCSLPQQAFAYRNSCNYSARKK